MKLKKVLAAILAVAMLLSLANICVFADEAIDTAVEETEVISESEEIVESDGNVVNTDELTQLQVNKSIVFTDDNENMLNEPETIYAAEVDNVQYETIEEALEHWTYGKPLTLLKDVTLDYTVTVEVNRAASTQNKEIYLGDFRWTAVGCDAFELKVTGATAFNMNSGFKIHANIGGGITVDSNRNCVKYAPDSSNTTVDKGYRPRLEFIGGTYVGGYVVYHGTIVWSSSPVGPATYFVKGADGNAPVFDAIVALGKSRVEFQSGTFNKAVYTYVVSSTSDVLISSGVKFKTLPQNGNNKIVTYYSNYLYYVDGYWNVVSAQPSEFEARVPATEVKNGSYAITTASGYKYAYTYFDKAEDAIKNYNTIILSADVSSDESKSTSSTLTIDATADGSNYTGNVVLKSSSNKFIVKTREDNEYYGVVTPYTGYTLHIEKTEENGIITTTYSSVKNVTEANAIAKVVDGDDVKYYLSVYDAFYAVDGTSGKKIVLTQDALNSTIITNGYAVNDIDGKTDVTFDLNGHNFSLQSAGTGNNADYTLTIIDSSEDKTGIVENDIFSLIKIAVDVNSGVDASGKYTLVIKGGTWQFNPTSYTKDEVTYNFVPNGYYAKKNENGTYTVLETSIEVLDTASELGSEITLVDLMSKLSETQDMDKNDTYEVVLDEPKVSVKDVVKATVEQKETYNTQEYNYDTSMALDISVIKTSDDGVSEYVEGYITNQEVSVKLSKPAKATDGVAIYHIKDNGEKEQITDYELSENNTVVTFIAPSFSAFVVKYNAENLDESDIANSLYVNFKATADERVYDIYVNSNDENLSINRLSAVELTFENIVASGNIVYEITPAAYVNLIEKTSDDYEFNFDGYNVHDASGVSIKIGSVKFIGYGELTSFGIEDDSNAVNIANTASANNNIVIHHIPDGSTTELVIGDDITLGGNDYLGKIGPYEFKAATKNLTINVKFNNIISDNAAAYQDMKVTVSGGDLTSPLEYKLGNGTNEIALNGDTYTVEIADTLTKNVGYTVKVEGAGYRTARHIVTMTENKVLNFWNNVKDSVNATVIETGKTPMTKNFLAGDIVKDNNINIYDLSAVVSYFGTENLVSAYPAYAKYDLNRDGVIDSKDVAYVLVSWGE
jgi:hypothetical protein